MEKSGLLNNGWISSTTYLSGFSEPKLSLKDIATAEERVSGEITGDEPKINGMSLNLNLCGCLDVAGTRVNFDVSKDGGDAIEIVAFDNDEYGEKLSENYNYMSSEIDSGNYMKVFQQASEQGNGNIPKKYIVLQKISVRKYLNQVSKVMLKKKYQLTRGLYKKMASQNRSYQDRKQNKQFRVLPA